MEYGFFHDDSKQEHRALLPEGCDVQGEGLLEGRRERHVPVLAARALGDADTAGAQVDVLQPDLHRFGDAHAGVSPRGTLERPVTLSG